MVNECAVCGDNNFDQVDGFFFCTTCQTQSQNIRLEESADFVPIRGLALRRLAVVTPASQRKQADTGRPWETVEAFQIILKKQVDALIEQGVNPKLSEVVFKLWMLYLSLTGNAFNNKLEDAVVLNKLADMRPRDRDIKPGTIEKPQVSAMRVNRTRYKNKRHSGTHADIVRRQLEETLGDEEFYEGDNPLTEEDVENRKGEEQISDSEFDEGQTRGKQYGLSQSSIYNQVSRLSAKVLVSFLHLGLLYCHNVVTPADLYKWIEGDILPFRNSNALLPEDMKFNVFDSNMFTAAVIPKPDSIRIRTGQLIKFLDLRVIPNIDLRLLASRYLVQLSLPGEMQPLVTRLLINIGYKLDVARNSGEYILISPEQVVMAYIVIVLKMLFVLDDKEDGRISHYARAVNQACPRLRMFVWDDWVTFHTHEHRGLDKLPRNVSEVLQVKDVTKCLEDQQINHTSMRHSEKRGRYDRFLRPKVRSALHRPIKTLTEVLRPKTKLATIPDQPAHGSHASHSDTPFASLNATLDLPIMESGDETDVDGHTKDSEAELFRQSTLKFITEEQMFIKYLQTLCSVEPMEEDNIEDIPGAQRALPRGCTLVSSETMKELLELPHVSCLPYHIYADPKTPWTKSYTACLDICAKVISCESEQIHRWTTRLETKVFHRVFTVKEQRKNKLIHAKYLNRLVKRNCYY